ncbi:unnamed protein product [Allacma fusca]|uniref:Uncharacterized protein n=1 Tax=Allacma fusca TaxID=39272 RepID=A0A8J2JXR3_9HEXA|nr:unnamed protein product [Allacma fusca]
MSKDTKKQNILPSQGQIMFMFQLEWQPRKTLLLSGNRRICTTSLLPMPILGKCYCPSQPVINPLHNYFNFLPIQSLLCILLMT